MFDKALVENPKNAKAYGYRGLCLYHWAIAVKAISTRPGSEEEITAKCVKCK